MTEPYAPDRTSDIITEINVNTNQGTYKIHQHSIINLCIYYLYRSRKGKDTWQMEDKGRHRIHSTQKSKQKQKDEEKQMIPAAAAL